MLLGRFLPMVFVLALAGSLAEQKPVPATAGTLRTEKPLFTGLLVGTILDHHRSDLLPGPRAGPAGRGAGVMTTTKTRTEEDAMSTATPTRAPHSDVPTGHKPARDGSARACSTRSSC